MASSFLDDLAGSLGALATELSALARSDWPQIVMNEDEVRETALQLRRAADRLDRIRRDVAQQSALSAYSFLGGEERRRVLQRELDSDVATGLGLWLQDVVDAASRFQLAALEALCSWDHLNGLDGTRQLVMHAESLLLSLQHGRYGARGPLLDEVVRSDHLAEAIQADDALLAQAALLLARICIHEGNHDEAAELLVRAAQKGLPESEVGPAVAWQQRLRGSLEASRDPLSRVEPTDPGHLAFVVENVAQLVGTALPQDRERRGRLARRQAFDGIASEPSLVGMEARLRSLIQETPADVWFAVGRRAAYEGYVQLTQLAFENARKRAWDDELLRADIARESAIFHKSQGNTSAAVDEWKAAGTLLLLAGRAEEAMPCYREVLDLEPRNQEALLLKSDAGWVVAATAQGPDRVEVAEEALADVRKAHALGGFSQKNSWAYSTWSNLHGTLAALPRADRFEHRQHALMKATLAIAHKPTDARRWALLADAATNARLYQLGKSALDVGSRYVSDASDRDLYATERVRSAANLGDKELTESRIVALGDDRSGYGNAAAGYIQLITGDAPQALRLTTGTGETVEADWVWDVALRAGLISSAPSTTDLATDFLARTSARAETVESLGVAVLANLVLRQGEDARNLAQRLADLDTPIGRGVVPAVPLLGEAYLATGQEREGLEYIGAYLGRAQTPALAAHWENVHKPTILRIVELYDRPQPDLSAIDAVVESRVRTLATRTDPVDEVRDSETLAYPSSSADEVRTMLEAVVALERGSTTELEEALNTGLIRVPRKESRALRATLQNHATVIEIADLVDNAARAVERDDIEAATGYLEGAAEKDAAETEDQVLARVADVDSAALASVLRSVRGAEEQVPAGDTTDAPSSEGEPEPDIVVEMPAHWFTGFDDPLVDHPVFTEYLPRVKLLSGDSIGPVHVRAVQDNVDDYRILLGGDEVEKGSANIEYRYADPQTESLLSNAGLAPDVPEGPGGMQAFDGPGVESGTLGYLLTCSAPEAVLSRLLSYSSEPSEKEPSPQGGESLADAVGGAASRAVSALRGLFRGEPQDKPPQEEEQEAG